MKPNDYIEHVLRTVSPYDVREMPTDETWAVHGIIGLASEIAETLAIVKRFMFYGGDRPLEWSALCDELGDVLWYIALILAAMDMSFEIIMDMNIEKLKLRYPNGFETAVALEDIWLLNL